LLHALLTFNRLANRIADITGNLLAPMTYLMMLLTVVVVVARYWFNIGLVPVTETIIYLHACVFLLGIGYTLRAGAHVRVDIIYQRLSAKGQACIDLLGALVFLLPMTGFILFASIDYVGLSWRLQEGSAEPGGLPGVYLLKSLMPLMAILLGLQGLAEIARALLTLLGHPPTGAVRDA
jgi:TRAP-type mannitol/chloroaromatic compound transport system permease small subunit